MISIDQISIAQIIYFPSHFFQTHRCTKDSTHHSIYVYLQASKNKDVFHKEVKDLTVADVYNIAAGIGRELEKLTDAFGGAETFPRWSNPNNNGIFYVEGAVFSDVMPKMICVLEMLESFAAQPQNFSSDVIELQSSLQKLQLEAKSNAEKHKEVMI